MVELIVKVCVKTFLKRFKVLITKIGVHRFDTDTHPLRYQCVLRVRSLRCDQGLRKVFTKLRRERRCRVSARRTFESHLRKTAERCDTLCPVAKRCRSDSAGLIFSILIFALQGRQHDLKHVRIQIRCADHKHRFTTFNGRKLHQPNHKNNDFRTHASLNKR